MIQKPSDVTIVTSEQEIDRRLPLSEGIPPHGDRRPCPGSSTGVSSLRKRGIDDFSINVATVNSSGSQSANSVLLKSIFGMGVPVSGKNLFPSNIAGQPTGSWSRASKEGYVARKRESEILIALNPDTAREDIAALPSGGVAICDENLKLDTLRSDIVLYEIPFDKITASVCPEVLGWPGTEPVTWAVPKEIVAVCNVVPS